MGIAYKSANLMIRLMRFNSGIDSVVYNCGSLNGSAYIVQKSQTHTFFLYLKVKNNYMQTFTHSL